MDWLIKQFAYKHPELWLKINSRVCKVISDYHKREKEKMSLNIKKLMRKLNKET